MSWVEVLKGDCGTEKSDLTPGQKSFVERSRKTLYSQKQEEAETNEVMQRLKVVYEGQMQEAMRRARSGATIAELKDELVNSFENELEMAE